MFGTHLVSVSRERNLFASQEKYCESIQPLLKHTVGSVLMWTKIERYRQAQQWKTAPFTYPTALPLNNWSIYFLIFGQNKINNLNFIEFVFLHSFLRTRWLLSFCFNLLFVHFVDEMSRKCLINKCSTCHAYETLRIETARYYFSLLYGVMLLRLFVKTECSIKPNCFERDRQSNWLSKSKSLRMNIRAYGVWYLVRFQQKL